MLVGMARQRIDPGTVGPVSVVPLGTTPDGDEQVIPAPRTDGGEPLPYPKGLAVGRAVKVETVDGMVEYAVTRWRGLARVVDVDGKQYQVRAWRDTKAAARSATEAAGHRKLKALADAREQAATEAANNAKAEADGDTDTTVADLVNQWLAGPMIIPGRNGRRVSAKTEQDYRYIAPRILSHPIASKLPRYVSVQNVKDFLTEVAEAHGRGSAKHVRALLSHALDIAAGSSGQGGPEDMHTPLNPTLGAKGAIPDVVSRTSTLNHKKGIGPTGAATLLWRLYHDPEALPMGTRHRGGRGEHSAVPNGKDIADLIAWLFSTGTRLGEALGLRWSDLVDLDGNTPSASIGGTVTYTVGKGAWRQPATKSEAGERSVPLHPRTVAMLRRRARMFAVDLDSPPATPVFGSPQKQRPKPDPKGSDGKDHPVNLWRDPNNLNKVIRKLFDRYGVTHARSHLGRKYRVTSLAGKGVGLRAIADVVGHAQTMTTIGYLSSTDGDDADVRAAL